MKRGREKWKEKAKVREMDKLKKKGRERIKTRKMRRKKNIFNAIKFDLIFLSSFHVMLIM